MAASGFDYFAGGSLGQRTGSEGSDQDLYEILEENGYTVADTQEAFNSVTAETGKVYTPAEALSGTAMKYAMDREEGEQTLADMVAKGIEVLDTNEEGFFMMTESGKIDWSEHANDAAATIKEVIDFQDAIQEAVDFYYEHPEDTLIVVTADHPTGGFTVGNSETGYNSYFHLIDNQAVSQEVFDGIFAAAQEENPEMTFEDFVPVLEENFGFIFDLEATEEVLTHAQKAELEAEEVDPMTITAMELEELRYAFDQSMLTYDERNAGQADVIKGYHSYLPISIATTRLLANKAGFAFTTVDHSPERVPVYAIGAGAAMFEGNFENSDVAYKLLAAMGLYQGGDTAVEKIAVTGKAEAAKEAEEAKEEEATADETAEETAEDATSEEEATEETTEETAEETEESAE